MDNLTMAGVPPEANRKVTKSMLLSKMRDLMDDMEYARKFSDFNELETTAAELQQMIEDLD